MPGPYVVIVNGVRFEVSFSSLQGIQVRALAGIPPEHSLIVEGAGTGADRLLREEDVVSLEDGPVHVFSKPPTAFGFLNSTVRPLG